MRRINTAGKSVDLFGAGKHGFQDGDPDLGISPTLLTDAWFNSVQEELAAMVEGAGVALDADNAHQIARLLGPLVYLSAGGTANALTLTVASPIAPAAYADGLRVRVKPTTPNTDAMTINLNALGVKSIVHADGSAIAARELRAGQFVDLIYSADLGKFVLQGAATRGRFMNLVPITSSTTFDPATYGAEDYYIEGVGPGCSGGTPLFGTTAVAAGGGAGCYVAGFTKISTSQTVIVGAPGAAQTTENATGNPGSDSSFGASITAGGGKWNSASTGAFAGGVVIPGQMGLALAGVAVGVAGSPAALGIGGWDPQGYGAGGTGALGQGTGNPVVGLAGRPGIWLVRY